MPIGTDDVTLGYLRRLLDHQKGMGPLAWDGTVLRDRFGSTVLVRHREYEEGFMARFAAVVDTWNQENS